MAVLIHVDNVDKAYRMGKKPIRVLSGVSLRVDAGETVAIVGASGAGKSTLLHIIGGLDAPDRGTVSFKGVDFYDGDSAPVDGAPARDSAFTRRIKSARYRTLARARHIGFVFQAYHLFPELNVFENTILPGMTRLGPAQSDAGIRERGLELLKLVGLSDRAEHRPMQLSGGEQQRLALARALMNDPELILADEPTGNLDDGTGQQVLDYVFSLTRDRGHTLVMVTHNEKVAAQCARTLRLAGGKLV